MIITTPANAQFGKKRINLRDDVQIFKKSGNVVAHGFITSDDNGKAKWTEFDTVVSMLSLPIISEDPPITEEDGVIWYNTSERRYYVSDFSGCGAWLSMNEYIVEFEAAQLNYIAGYGYYVQQDIVSWPYKFISGEHDVMLTGCEYMFGGSPALDDLNFVIETLELGDITDATISYPNWNSGTEANTYGMCALVSGSLGAVIRLRADSPDIDAETDLRAMSFRYHYRYYIAIPN